MKTDTDRRSGPFRIEWTSRSAVKKVTLIDEATGRRYVGTDWANWDAAWRQALHEALFPANRSSGDTPRRPPS